MMYTAIGVFFVLFLSLAAEGYPPYQAIPVNAQQGIFIPLNHTNVSSNNQQSQYGWNNNVNNRNPPYPVNSNNNQNNNNNGWNRNLPYPTNGVNNSQQYGTNNNQQNMRSVSQNGKDLVYGRRENGDTVLFKTIVFKKVGWFRSSAEKDIDFPAKGSKMRVSRITSIEVKDNTPSNNGGFTQIMKGGVGSPAVVFRFLSKNDNPINLEVLVYGFH